jgi:hypothetical protein
MNPYLIIWQEASGLTHDLLVCAESEQAAREELEAIFEEGDRILSCEKAMKGEGAWKLK